MNDWTMAVLAMLPALLIAVVGACRGGTASRLAAVQLAAAVAVLCLELMTFAFDQSAFIDLPLCLALLTLPGTLILALFLERWL